ncbi:MAG: hypothetical protein QM485_05005 [Flavobacteriaceae bacterium]
MKLNNIKNISKIIYLLDTKIIELFNEKELDEKRIDILSQVRFDYMKELNGLLRVRNTRDMFDQKYYKSYKKSHY